MKEVEQVVEKEMEWGKWKVLEMRLEMGVQSSPGEERQEEKQVAGELKASYRFQLDLTN
ncbi:MAG: hypothetical protein ACE5KG_01935 [Nitrososphaerales archaeon]